MSDAERIASFMRLASEEIAAARLLISAALRQAAYFVQQAAEKSTRAVLTAAGVPFGTSHNLGQMAAALPGEHPLRTAVLALDRYSSAATRYRYPNPAGRLAEPPASDSIASGVDEVEAFMRLVQEHLGKLTR